MVDWYITPGREVVVVYYRDGAFEEWARALYRTRPAPVECREFRRDPFALYFATRWQIYETAHAARYKSCTDYDLEHHRCLK